MLATAAFFEDELQIRVRAVDCLGAALPLQLSSAFLTFRKLTFDIYGSIQRQMDG